MLQSGYSSNTFFYFGDYSDGSIHGSWSVDIPNMEHYINRWLQEHTVYAPNKFSTKISSVRIESMGGFANKMIQFMVGNRISASVPRCRLVHDALLEWGITSSEFDGAISKSVRFGPGRHRLDIVGITSCLNRGMIDTVVVDSYAQHFDNFPDVATARRLFVTPSALDHVRGFGADRLVISIRGGEILDGRHPDYILLPPSFYEGLIEQTGLKPVFFGQIEDNAYCLALRARFPRAEFVAGQGVMHDFAVLRRSCHIVPSISTFSWLAAWLSEAESVHLPVAGLFNPRQARAHFLLPLDDPRYRFHLFPLAYAVDVAKYPHHFATMQRALDGTARLVSAERLRAIIEAAPQVKRRIDAYLAFYDDAFYSESQGDIGAAVRDGLLPSALHHYLEHGFREERPCFKLDPFHYATRYPLAAAEVAQGEYLDFEHHYVEIGHRRGYTAAP